MQVTRSRQQLQPRRCDELGPESIHDVQSGATEGSGDHPGELVSEPGQQTTGQGLGMPTAQLRQDLSVWAWTEIDSVTVPQNTGQWGEAPCKRSFWRQRVSVPCRAACLPLGTMSGFQVASLAP